MADKSFPTAVGAGANSRGDVVYTHRIVTNLNDSGAGSFRDAYQSNSIISFNVSGLITNTNITFANKENVIILGQTAPEGGIEYGGAGARFDYSENVIWRYISFRNLWFGRDAIDFIGCKNVILDHVSVSFGGDETLSFRASYADAIVENISVTNCHLNFSKTGMLLGDTGDMTKSSTMSSIGNLWGVISHRTPNTGGHARFDVIGNTVYDYSSRLMVTIGNAELNERNNYYLSFDPSNARNQARIVEYTPSIYTEGNIHTGQGTGIGDDNWELWQNRVFSYSNGETDIYPIPTSFRSNTMFPLMNFDVNDLEDADYWLDKATVKKDVGNCARLGINGEKIQQIQDIDAALFSRIENETSFPWTGANDYKVIPELVNWQDNTYPNEGGIVVNTHDPSLYTATVSNAWITANGMTPATFNPVGNDLDPLYTNIEMYSFGIDTEDNLPILTLNGASTITLTIGDTYTELGATASDTEDGDITNDIVITGTVDASTAGTYTITYNVQDSNLNNAIPINRTIIIEALPTIEIPILGNIALNKIKKFIGLI